MELNEIMSFKNFFYCKIYGDMSDLTRTGDDRKKKLTSLGEGVIYRKEVYRMFFKLCIGSLQRPSFFFKLSHTSESQH